MSFLVDTHCHLDLFKDIKLHAKDEDALGIKTVSVTNAPGFFVPNTQLFASSLNIRIALGFHPELVQRYIGEIGIFGRLLSQTRYIGEIGLDGSTQFQSTYLQQLEIFQQLLSLIAIHEKKVLTVHSRGAAAETISQLHKYLKGTSTKAILHWFSGSLVDLQAGLNYGFYFSINHKMVATERGRQIIHSLPMERILTETDAPFTFSGAIQTRMGSLEASIKGIAEIKRIDERAAKQAVYENFRTLLL
jgi:TatD DNase family protein